MRATASRLISFAKGRDIITLFHKDSVAASNRVHTLLKQVSATAGETSTIDQAGDHTGNHKNQRHEFDLEVTQSAPTADQLRTIIEYLGGASSVSKLIQGATGPEDAIKKLSASADAFTRPLVVDWNNGKAVAGDNESEILKMLGAVKPSEVS